MYQLSYWKYACTRNNPDDLDEVMKPRRIKRVNEIDRLLRPIPKECDVVLLERTDKQSLHTKTIWTRK